MHGTAVAPNFLIISPGKTGSTWLADKLGRHPQIFIPAEKELNYFSFLHKAFDLNWYFEQFRPAAGCVKGEASPTYALLPVASIEQLHRLLPDVKLIFLMREPVARAWSHAKHCHRFRESNFNSCAKAFAAITDQEWRDNLCHDWTLAHGDYLGQMRRWLSVFPRRQVYVGFYESIAHRPEVLLRELFAFLGVDADVDLAGFQVAERVLAGQVGEMCPQLARFAQRLLSERTQDLANYLGEELDLTPPAEWSATLQLANGLQKGQELERPAAFERACDDRYLAGLLEQAQMFSSVPLLIEEGYRGYNLIYYRGQLHAIAQYLGPFQLNEGSEQRLRRWQEAGVCFVASTLAEVKQRVDTELLESARADGEAHPPKTGGQSPRLLRRLTTAARRLFTASLVPTGEAPERPIAAHPDGSSR
jgi:hypothetical protein